MTQNIMEQESESFNDNHHDPAAVNDSFRSDLDNKRLKELRNAALLQTTLTARMETEGSTADSEARETGGEEELSNGVAFNHDHRPDEPLHSPPGPDTEMREEEEEGGGAEEQEEEEETDSTGTKERVAEEQRTLTDHLNKRLLSSFLEKLKERDLALPGVQHLDCAVEQEEDSNRAAEEW
ncbi:hypothetical protein NHX12_032995 [Muraenolepis orangiensis]|uniref:Uncharacterized protein n=1 Tax=Muraenolepis orangiensis TaxID=630683 RepID=A0A9Q0E1P1_9TELE|nr:hypothetical protein NHX12_032995 [Muraenolepis orangiensis]